MGNREDFLERLHVDVEPLATQPEINENSNGFPDEHEENERELGYETASKEEEVFEISTLENIGEEETEEDMQEEDFFLPGVEEYFDQDEEIDYSDEEDTNLEESMEEDEGNEFLEDSGPSLDDDDGEER